MTDFLDNVRDQSQDSTDLSVYDLAERMAGGVTISEPGQVEVAKELLRVREALRRAIRQRLDVDFASDLDELERSMGIK